MMNDEEVTISENLLNQFVQTIAENVPYAKAQPVFQQLAAELANEQTPSIHTGH